MNLTSIGDLAQGLMLRTRTADIKSTIETLSYELSTGRTSDVAARLGGDYSYLSDIDRNLSRLGGFAIAATEATLSAGVAQIGLGRLHDATESLGANLLTVTPSNLGIVRANIGDQARAGLETVVAALNSSAGGRSLFSGIATDHAPLGLADTLIADLKTQVAGLSTATAFVQAIDDWFADPAGFQTVMYSGSDQSLAPVQVGANEYVALSLRADDPEFQDVMRNMAIAALATDSDLGLTADMQNTLLQSAGEGLLRNQDSLAGLRADLGFAEARLEEASTRNASARTGLEYAKNTLLEADPYDTATRLQEAQFQLESLYSVTVRNSRLSLVSFLK